LRQFLLGKLEIFLGRQLSKAALEEILCEEARTLGAGNLVPTTMHQFKKLTSFLHGEIRFYVACCAPCNRTARLCPVCKAELWAGKRPKHVAFVRSVKDWLTELLTVPALARAIELYRLRRSSQGSYADVLDGRVVQQLIQRRTDIMRDQGNVLSRIV
jgi:hypothetical protein